MKKFLCVVVTVVFMAMPVYALQEENNYYDKVNDFASEYDIDFKEVTDNPLESLLNVFKNSVKKGLSNPFKFFYKIAAVLLLTSFISFFATDSSKRIVNLVNAVAVVVLFTNVFTEFIALNKEINEGLVQVKNFMTTFIPVFAGISFASGEIITSTVYTGFFLVSIVVTAGFCTEYIVPSVNLFLVLGITNAVSETVNLKPICDFCSKIIKFAMVAAVSVLCFLLTVQTTITSGQDSLAVKTGKLLISSAVPIIGSTLQSAAGSIYAGMGVLKGFCGIVGVAAVLNLFLPALTKLVVNWIGYYLMLILSEILENKTMSDLLEVFKDVIEILISMSFLFLVLLLFSLTIMIKAGTGG